MNVIYFSHSYKGEDTPLNDYFGNLARKEKLVLLADPPSGAFTAAKMVRSLGQCDGMIAILTDRPDGVSPYILFEVNQCIKARKPLLVFIEDTIPDDLIPARILQRRFSRRSYYHEVREHTHVVQTFKGYLCEKVPPKYHVNPGRKKCLLVGTLLLPEKTRTALTAVIENHGFAPVIVNTESFPISENISFSDTIVSADLAVVILKDDSRADQYLGLFGMASVPVITLIEQHSDVIDKNLVGLKFVSCDFSNPDTCKKELLNQIRVFEQEYLELDEKEEIKEYTDLLTRCGSPDGGYTDETRTFIINKLDQLVLAKDVGIIQKEVNAQQIHYNANWDRVKNEVDFDTLIEALNRIEEELKKPEYSAQQKLKKFISEAIEAAKAHDGPKLLELFEKLKPRKEFLADLSTKVLSGASASVVVFLLNLVLH